MPSPLKEPPNPLPSEEGIGEVGLAHHAAVEDAEKMRAAALEGVELKGD